MKLKLLEFPKSPDVLEFLEDSPNLGHMPFFGVTVYQNIIEVYNTDNL